MEGRDRNEQVAATRMESGTDVIIGSLTSMLICTSRGRTDSPFFSATESKMCA